MKCLLISNSQPDLEDHIIRIFTAGGHEVERLSDTNDVIDHIQALKPPLVAFTNIDSNTLKLVQQIKQNNFSCVTLALFDAEPAMDIDQLLDSGLDDVILPPLNTFRLESRLQFVLVRAQQRQERVDIENALRKSEDNALAVLNTTVDGIITMGEDRIIQSFNRAAEQIFGYTAREVIGKNVKVLMPPPYRDEHDEYVNSYHETNHKKIIGIGREVRGLKKNGEVFPMELAVSEIKDNGRRTYTGIIRDISVRRELEKEILRTSEEERRRIGQDLHDGLGQMLTGIGLIAKNLANHLAAQNIAEGQDLFELVDLIKEADQQTRSIARTLVPLDLERGGLKAASLRLNENIERLYGLKCFYEETGTVPKMEANVNTHFFRIIQEAMNNAAKHSKATRLTVAVAGNPDQVRARIQDNGTGIDFANVNGRGMGLRIMKHRANVIGATLDIRNGSKNGTVVTCTLPLKASSDAHA